MVPIFSLRQHSEDCQVISIEEDEIQAIGEILQDDPDFKLDDPDFKQEHDLDIANNPTTSSAGTSSQSWLSELKLAFPDAKDNDLEDIASVATTIDGAACLLLDKQDNDLEEDASLEDLIESFVKKNELPGDESIKVDRETLWPSNH